MRLDALFELAFATATPLYGLTLPRLVSRRLIKQKARGHPENGLLRSHLAPTACKHTVSGSISLPSPGFFSPFPHGTGSLSVASNIQPWEMVLPASHGIARVPQYSGTASRKDLGFHLRDYHPLWLPFPGAFDYLKSW